MPCRSCCTTQEGLEEVDIKLRLRGNLRTSSKSRKI